MATDLCSRCDEVRGRVIPPGSVIFDAGHWIAARHPVRFTKPPAQVGEQDGWTRLST